MSGSIPQPPALPGPDGKDYLATLFSSGQQSRQIIYFILIVIALTFAATRNGYSPDWMGHRVAVFQELATCLDGEKMNAAHCAPLKTRMTQLGFGPNKQGKYDVAGYASTFGISIVGGFDDASFLESNKAASDEIKARVAEFVRRDTDFFSVTIPALGITLDTNDLWLVSGGGMSFLLFLLSSSLHQEARNLTYIARYWPGFARIGAMNQTLSYRAVGSSSAYEVVRSIFWFIPTILYIYIILSDWQTSTVSTIYLGRCHSNLEFLCEVGILFVVIVLNWRCLSRQRELENLVRQYDGG